MKLHLENIFPFLPNFFAFQHIEVFMKSASQFTLNHASRSITPKQLKGPVIFINL